MPYSDIEARVTIDGTTDPGLISQIKMLLTQIYEGSPLAAAKVNSWLLGHPGQQLTITYQSGAASTVPSVDGSGIIHFDPNGSFGYYITSTGKAVESTAEVVLAHELGHAVTGLRDDDSFSNLDGSNDDLTNPWYIQLSLAERATYEAVADAPDLSPGADYTGGQTIDNAIVDVGYYDNTALGGVAFDTGNIDLAGNGVTGRTLVIGGSGSNSYGGTADTDWLYGNGGFDILAGGGGNDFIYGGGGGDQLSGGDGADEIWGGDNPALASSGVDSIDTIDGGAGNDKIYGGGGDDIISGGAGNDEIWGGDKGVDAGVVNGTDTADYRNGASAITVNYNGSGSTPVITVQDGTGGTDTLHSIEKIIGTSKRDILAVGSAIRDSNLTFDANGGQTGAGDVQDLVNGKKLAGGFNFNVNASGHGSLTDLTTNQHITLDNFHTAIVGSNFDDTIVDLSDGPKTIDGGDGNDTVSIGGPGYLIGGNGNDILTGGAGDDYLEGGDGNDILTGGAGSDILYGDGGFDQLSGGEGSDLLVAGVGIGFNADGDVTDVLLDGGVGNDKLVAGIGILGNIVLQGGAGNDVYDLQSDSSSSFAQFTIKINPGDGHDTIIGNVFSSGFSGSISGPYDTSGQAVVDFTHWSRDDAEIIWDAQPNPDHVDGIDSDYLRGDLVVRIKATGESVLFHDVTGWWFPNGNPTIINHDHYTDGHVFINQDQAVVLFSDGPIISTDGVINIDGRIGSVAGYDTAEADYAAGLPLAPPSTGGTGDDNLRGTSGNDSLSGGDGNDRFASSYGTDIIDGGAGYDEFDVFGARADYTVVSGDNGSVVVTSLSNQDYQTTLTSVESIFFAYDGRSYSIDELVPILGTPGDDTLYGTGGDNELDALDGDDIVVGGGGDDRIDGGAGNDVAEYVGSRSNFAIGTDRNGDILVWDRSGAEGFDTLTGVEALHFAGDNQTILADDVTSAGIGTAGDDVFTEDVAWSIDGGDGNDVLVLDGSVSSEATGGSYFGLLAGGTVIANVETIWFKEDNVFLDTSQIPTFGTSGSDTITGTARADFIDNEDGNDVVVAGNGNDQIFQELGTLDVTGGAGDDQITSYDQGDDIYRYDRGDGQDIIRDQGGSNDRLVFGSSITSDDVVVTADFDTGNLVVTFNDFAGKITLYSAQSDPSYFIEEFRFSDNTIWNADDILAKAGIGGGQLAPLSAAEERSEGTAILSSAFIDGTSESGINRPFESFPALSSVRRPVTEFDSGVTGSVSVARGAALLTQSIAGFGQRASGEFGLDGALVRPDGGFWLTHSNETTGPITQRVFEVAA